MYGSFPQNHFQGFMPPCLQLWWREEDRDKLKKGGKKAISKEKEN